MVVRGDVTFTYSLSPRIITVDAPSTELTVQDLVDTIRDSEDEEINLEDRPLLSAGGKEDLGGSVSVGTTATLLDTVISFEARKVWTSAGTVTTGDATGRNLIDAGATFISDGIVPGAWIVNFTDLSICSVLKVVSETELRTDVLGAGSDNQFDSSDVYRVMVVIQCEVDGGNAVAVDKTGVSISPILPTAGTQVIRSSASQATFRNSLDIEHSSFEGAVTVDQGNQRGFAVGGTIFPTGTIRQPCNNLTDAAIIALVRGFRVINIIGDVTMGSGDNFDDFEFFGEGPNATTFTIATGASVLRCKFDSGTITGTLDGGNRLGNLQVGSISFVNGFVRDCTLIGPIILGGGVSATIIRCEDGIIGGSSPEIDCGGSGQDLAVRGYHGDLLITNKTGTDDIEIDLESGVVTLDTTVTNGNIVVRGTGAVINNSTGTAVVDTTSLNNPNTIGNATRNKLIPFL